MRLSQIYQGLMKRGGGVPAPPRVAAPVFSPLPGTFTTSLSVTITSTTPGATIRYTTDGVTVPSALVGTVYSGPVPLATTTLLQAIAYDGIILDSGVTSDNYVINYPAVGAPRFSPPAGSFLVDTSVTIISRKTKCDLCFSNARQRHDTD